LQFFARRRGHDLQAALRLIFGVHEAQERLAALEEPGEDVGEVLVDAREGFVELGPRNLVDLLDRLLRVLDRFDEVLALLFQEGMARGGLVVLFKSHHVHRAHLLQALAERATLLFLGSERFALHARNRRNGAKLFGRRVHFSEATALEVLDVGAQPGHRAVAAGALFAQRIERCAG